MKLFPSSSSDTIQLSNLDLSSRLKLELVEDYDLNLESNEFLSLINKNKKKPPRSPFENEITFVGVVGISTDQIDRQFLNPQSEDNSEDEGSNKCNPQSNIHLRRCQCALRIQDCACAEKKNRQSTDDGRSFKSYQTSDTSLTTQTMQETYLMLDDAQENELFESRKSCKKRNTKSCHDNDGDSFIEFEIPRNDEVKSEQYYYACKCGEKIKLNVYQEKNQFQASAFTNDFFNDPQIMDLLVTEFNKKLLQDEAKSPAHGKIENLPKETEMKKSTPGDSLGPQKTRHEQNGNQEQTSKNHFLNKNQTAVTVEHFKEEMPNKEHTHKQCHCDKKQRCSCLDRDASTAVKNGNGQCTITNKKPQIAPNINAPNDSLKIPKHRDFGVYTVIDMGKGTEDEKGFQKASCRKDDITQQEETDNKNAPQSLYSYLKPACRIPTRSQSKKLSATIFNKENSVQDDSKEDAIKCLQIRVGELELALSRNVGNSGSKPVDNSTNTSYIFEPYNERKNILNPIPETVVGYGFDNDRYKANATKSWDYTPTKQITKNSNYFCEFAGINDNSDAKFLEDTHVIKHEKICPLLTYSTDHEIDEKNTVVQSSKKESQKGNSLLSDVGKFHGGKSSSQDNQRIRSGDEEITACKKSKSAAIKYLEDQIEEIQKFNPVSCYKIELINFLYNKIEQLEKSLETDVPGWYNTSQDFKSVENLQQINPPSYSLNSEIPEGMNIFSKPTINLNVVETKPPNFPESTPLKPLTVGGNSPEYSEDAIKHLEEKLNAHIKACFPQENLMKNLVNKINYLETHIQQGQNYCCGTK